MGRTKAKGRKKRKESRRLGVKVKGNRFLLRGFGSWNKLPSCTLSPTWCLLGSESTGAKPELWNTVSLVACQSLLCEHPGWRVFPHVSRLLTLRAWAMLVLVRFLSSDTSAGRWEETPIKQSTWRFCFFYFFGQFLRDDITDSADDNKPTHSNYFFWWLDVCRKLTNERQILSCASLINNPWLSLQR